ncbi:hypothetical protein ACRC7T_04485 [Segnochrobactraceae bacterium EtOH-i3]
MASLRLPLAGDVTQFFRSWMGLFNQRDGQVGLLNVSVDLGQTSAPEVEEEVLREVGTYGHQLGRIGDALAVLVNHVDPSKLTPEEDKALRALGCMLDDLARIREKHGRSAIRSRYPVVQPVVAEAEPAPEAPRPRAPARRRKTTPPAPASEG